MHHLLKWRSLILALGAVFVPLVSAAATLLKVEGSGAVPGFNSSELSRYLTCIWLKLSLPIGVSSQPRLAIRRHPTALSAENAGREAGPRSRWNFGPCDIKALIHVFRNEGLKLQQSSRRAGKGDPCRLSFPDRAPSEAVLPSKE